MKKTKRMNIFYKLAFIFLLICILMLVAAIIVAYALEQPVLSVVFSGAGAFLAFLGIIFAAISKPKKASTLRNSENIENNIDN